MIHSTMIAYITLITINYCITSGFSRVIVNIVSCFLYSKRFVKTFVRYCTHIYVCNRFQYWKKYFIVCFLLCLYFHYSDNELPQTAISWKIIYAHGNRMTRFTPDEIAKLIYNIETFLSRRHSSLCSVTSLLESFTFPVRSCYGRRTLQRLIFAQQLKVKQYF